MKRFTEKRYLIHKRIITTVLSLVMTLTLSVPCVPVVPVYGAEFVGIGVAEAVLRCYGVWDDLCWFCCWYCWTSFRFL